MTTRQDLRSLIRRRLGDLLAPVGFSDMQINQWVVDSIAEYSKHFPRTLTTTISTTADDRKYDLPEDYIGALSVEYPTGEDPPAYLLHREYTHANFWQVDGYYSVVKRDDGTDVDELWMSKKPGAGETITMMYHGNHDYLDADADVCTVPDNHIELLVLFVRWLANQEIASTEAREPDPTSLNINTMELNTFRAERAYRNRLKEYRLAAGKSVQVRWAMDKHDSVY
ncbi:hypothetical protein LCGC14_0705770 [marine sediment metagenome]|uniref:Uncharacterized protein n=1 Tax=marine sediment metagenome TaxID=412755 RepID=A0A0F9T2H5_9ZZZZ|nr:hypothetical protein [bacterium]